MHKKFNVLKLIIRIDKHYIKLLNDLDCKKNINILKNLLKI